MAKEQKKSIADEKAIDELADVIVEGVREHFHSDLEPFEAYADRLRHRLHDDIRTFKRRFHHGYRVLLEQIAKEQG